MKFIQHPVGFGVAIVLYVTAWLNLPREQLMLVFTDPNNIGGVAALAAAIAWTLRNEI